MRTDNTAAGEDTPTAALLRQCAAKTVDALLANFAAGRSCSPSGYHCKRPPFIAGIASNNFPIS